MLLKACSLFGMDDDRARFACVLAEQGGLDGRPWRMRLRSPCRSQGTGQVGEGNGPRNRSQHNPSASSLCRAPRPVMTTRSEEHTSELQSLMRLSYAVFCLKKTI